MKIKNKNLIVLALAGSVGLSACGGGGGGGDTPSVPNSDLVYMADASVDGTNELFSNTRDGSEHRTLTEASFGAGVVHTYRISSNGRYIAFMNEGDMLGVSELYVDDLDDELPPLKVSGDLVADSEVFSFKWSPNSDRLAFTVNHETGFRHELYIVSADSAQPQLVSADMIPRDNDSFTLDREAYDWSPNGQRLAYIADQDSAFVAELYSVSENGLDNTKMNGDLEFGGDVVGFKWSPDSQRVMYRADQDTNTVYELYSSLASGLILINLKLNVDPDPMTGGNVSNRYDWSHDSASVAYLGDLDTIDKRELYTSGFNGGDKVKVSLNAIDNVSTFIWSPVENRLAYVAVDGDRSDLYSVLPSGLEHALLSDPMNPDDAIVHAYAWAPDGSRVAIERYISSTDETDLFTVSVDGLTRDPINTQGNVGSFAWSPDSQSIAYRADQDTAGTNELYVASFDGQNITKVNGPLGFGGDVTTYRWSPDGESLAYRADLDVDSPHELYVVDLDGMNLVKVSTSLTTDGNVGNFSWRP